MALPVPSDPIMRQPSVDLGEKQEPRRMIRQRGFSKKGLAPCVPNREEVSLCSLCQNELVQRQIRHRSTKPAVLGLKLFQPLHLIALQTAILVSPSIVRYFRHPYRSDSVRHLTPLCHQHIDLSKLRNDLFSRMPL